MLCIGRAAGKPRECVVCRRARARVLCDAPRPRLRYTRKSGSKTCDRPLCEGCAISAEPDVDVCPEHRDHLAALAAQPGLFG